MVNNYTPIRSAVEYWNARYKSGRNSGDGSYGEQLAKKLTWLSNLDITSIYEIGCGDFNFGKNLLNLYPNATYIGNDISQEIVNTNSNNSPYIFTTSTMFVPADLVLCVDVLFHVLDDKDYEDLLNRLDKYTKYLAVTAYDYDDGVYNHLVFRKFDYKRFGKPVIRKVVEKSGNLYFYLFKRG